MTSGLIPEVYVLWHPGFANGEALAQRVLGWLRPHGLGPHVFYRSLPAPGALPGCLPPPIPGDSRPALAPGDVARYRRSSLGNLQVVLLLSDAHLIADPAWRYWINGLAETATSAKRVILPVALDGTAYNVPAALQSLNFLRPLGVPPQGGYEVWDADVLATVTRSLLKQLTETLCDLLLNADECSKPPSLPDPGRSKVKIFLSHAKADGTEPARRIRDYIYGQTQIAAFYDENDIPYGDLFDDVLNRNVEGSSQSAAMIAIRSARYADRPWCRRELAQFRRPQQLASSEGQAEFWTLNPVLVVDALDGSTQTFCIPELGNAPTIRWLPGNIHHEELVVTTALREVLLAAHHGAVGRKIPSDRDSVVLNWLPDPGTLMYIPAIRSGSARTVFYPGRDLSGAELKTLAEFFPHISFVSFDRVTP